MHDVDSWFNLDVRIDEPTRRRQSFNGGSLTTQFTFTVDLTIPAAVAPADELERPRR
ncbi:hypothetical protein [Amycolatopsis saalfeldensis]|uniref:Uncharacterized protein n=1 Tax=Amycolatopsis saalfeldensis TaxID=394193 RepID=A0A1H8XH58_9PSEU|nr:hypothetical protein [Amycolatopsis saalfeldensis]SEP39077.1 hypothetical protein SAMN04489732_107221 [Amycolatopsis saalfeldensis]